jgi:hypothetical protein
MSKVHMNAPTPHTPMQSLHPNHVHTFDVSVCIQYYLKNGRLGIMDERDFYKNKIENFAKIKTRLLRYLLTDHFSGAFKVRYYNTTGESAENLWNFLKWAWGVQCHEKLPFRGVPFVLLMDTGSANKSHAILNFLERLEVTIPKGLPYNRDARVRRKAPTTSSKLDRIGTPDRAGDNGRTDQHLGLGLGRMAPSHQGSFPPRHDANPSMDADQGRAVPGIPCEEILQDIFQGKEETRTVTGSYTIPFGARNTTSNMSRG